MVDQILDYNGTNYLLNCCLQKLLIKNDKLVKHNILLVNKIVSKVQLDEEVSCRLNIFIPRPYAQLFNAWSSYWTLRAKMSAKFLWTLQWL